MRFLLFCLLIVPSSGFGQFTPSGENTLDDLHLLARELRSNQRVLFVMVAPSDEDVERIAHVRLTKHARVRLAYLTNGDGLPDGIGMPYPNQTAARWRGRAYDMAVTTGSDHTFMNLPYIDAASTEGRVRVEWPLDSVRRSWRDLLRDEKPDVVLISGLEHLPADHPLMATLLSDIASASRRAMRSRDWLPLQIAVASGFRSVERSAGTGEGRAVLDAERRLRSGYDGLLAPENVRRTYRLFDWRSDSLGSPVASTKLFPLRRVPSPLATIDSAVQSFSRRLLRLRSVPFGKKREEYLVPLVDIMQELDVNIAQMPMDEIESRRFLLDWKLSLEQIRGVLLGVRVWWHLSEKILTERQITHLTIDSISGLDPQGKTEIFFPEVRNGWVVNERQANHLPYAQGQEFRLFSTATMPFDLPRSLYGLSRPVFAQPWYVFVVHQAGTSEYNFSYRIDLGIIGAPRFSVEVLTPVVRAVDNEEVAFRIANHSRDGVSDNVYVSGSLVRSTKGRFRLLAKDMVHQDTIRLDWDDAPAGPYLVDLTISGDPVANFLARRFPIVATEGKPVTLVGFRSSSALYPALKRLGYDVAVVEPAAFIVADASPSSTILVDEWLNRGTSLHSQFWSNMRSAAEKGAQITVFSQRHDVLNTSSLFPSVRFTPTFVADTSYSISSNGTDELLRTPNDLTGGTWEGWLYRVASNTIKAQKGTVVEHAYIEGTKAPVIFSVRIGRGTVTYVDLNLSPQWANVLPAAYALLANLVEHEAFSGDSQ